MEVNVHEAKTHLSRLLEKVEAGEEVIIARAGKPVARLTAITPKQPVLGSARGTFTLKEGWDAPLTEEEIDELFDGELFPK
jgi:prevent-host-death family protein